MIANIAMDLVEGNRTGSVVDTVASDQRLLNSLETRPKRERNEGSAEGSS